MKLTISALSALAAIVAATSAVQAQGGPAAVECAPVTEQQMSPTMRLVGTVLPNRRTTVGAEVSGKVVELPVREGQLVEAGDIICKLEDSVRRHERDAAAGQLKRLQEAVKELEAGEREEDIDRLRAASDEANADLERWEFEKNRVTRLREMGNYAPKEYTDAITQYNAAVSRQKRADAELRKGVAGARKEVVEAARFAAMSQEASVRRMDYELEQTVIRAPFRGHITTKMTEVGQWIEQGGAVVSMIEIDPVRVRVNVPESLVAFNRPGAEASALVEAIGVRVHGRVSYLIPDADIQARTFPVDLEFSNADAKLMPGMFVRAEVPSGPASMQLTVLKDAVNRSEMGTSVWVVRSTDQGDTAMPMPVQVGSEWKNRVAITAPGLAAGDRVIVRGNEGLRGPGPVLATPFKGSAAEDGKVTPQS